MDPAIRIRKAIALDAASMARLINGNLALMPGHGAVTLCARDLSDWMAASDRRTLWLVAADEAEAVAGFQWLGPSPALPPQAAEIATFVRSGEAAPRIGSRLFEVTRTRARKAGYRWINATVAADNEGAQIFYQSRGFARYAHETGHRDNDGRFREKVLMRFDL